jgi:hypothetical protein
MKLYVIRDSEVMGMRWFSTKAEAMKAFSGCGTNGHPMEVNVVELGSSKPDLINLLNNFACNWDELVDGMDIDLGPEIVTHTETILKEKGNFYD